MEKPSKGLRYNKGKVRMDLLPPKAMEEIAKVFTYGSHKYGDNNYRKGMEWSKCLASMKRHILDFEKGIDFDSESGCRSLACAATNAIFLLEYYYIAPEYDDREHWWQKPFKRVYYDIDGVLADFSPHFMQYFGLEGEPPQDWNDPRFRDNFHKVKDDKQFWLDCPPLVNPKEISYPISGYCTARPIENEIIKEWLDKHNFPSAEIINVGKDGNKVEALKDVCDVMIDDSINNFVKLNSSGILCYLMTRPHNEKYDVGHMRVNSMKEFVERLKN